MATVVVELCREPACRTVVQQFEGHEGLARPPRPLAPGVWYWRVRDRATAMVTPVWTLMRRRAPGEADGPVGLWHDLDRDGFADLLQEGAWFRGSRRGLAIRPAAILQPPAGEEDRCRDPYQYEITPSPCTHSAFVVGDLDGDGHLDAVAEMAAHAGGDSPRGSQVWVYPGTPSGLSATPSTKLSRPPSGPEQSTDVYVVAALGDVNGDGYADLAVSTSAGRLLLFGGVRGRGPRVAPLPDGRILPAGDFDADGYADAVFSAREGETTRVSLYRGGPEGFEARPVHSLEASEIFPGTSANEGVSFTADVDGDGRLDLVAVHLEEDEERELAVVLTTGPRGLTVGRRFRLFGNGLRSVGDINGDGRDDLAEPNDPDSYELYFGSARGPVHRSIRRGPLSAGWSMAHGWAFGGSVEGIGDVDGDGRDDLLIGISAYGAGDGGVFLQRGRLLGSNVLPDWSRWSFDWPRRGMIR
jgi:hypothetical protein